MTEDSQSEVRSKIEHYQISFIVTVRVTISSQKNTILTCHHLVLLVFSFMKMDLLIEYTIFGDDILMFNVIFLD